MSPFPVGTSFPLRGPKHHPPNAPLFAYTVMFYERDAPQKRITALLADTPPTPTAVSSGYEQVQLPKRSAVLVWRGRSGLMGMDVPIFLGGPDSGPVIPARNVLNSMWRPADPTVEPPVVKIRSPGDAVPYQSLAWVVDQIAWGNATGDRGGHRTMQALTVTLVQFRDDETLQATKARKPKHRGRTYTVKAGDTLTSIAKRFNVKGGWRALGNAQHPPIHDPRSIKVGQRLLIP